MQNLLSRLAALDPAVADDVRVIAYFDDLTASRAGLDGLTRAAAVLAGCTAGVSVPTRQIQLRIDSDGRRVEPKGPDSNCVVLHLDTSDPPPLVWLERRGGLHANDAMILERFAAGVRGVLDRTATTGRNSRGAHVEVLLIDRASDTTRSDAAHRLGLDDQKWRVIATPGHVDAPAVLVRRHAFFGGVRASIVDADQEAFDDSSAQLRAGIGPAGRVNDLPAGWRAAQLALLLTAEGTPTDPGPRQVRSEELGALALLAELPRESLAGLPDMQILRDATRLGPWVLATADAIATHGTARQAATALHIHHSTLAERIRRLEPEMGFALETPAGRLRLHLALVVLRWWRNTHSQ